MLMHSQLMSENKTMHNNVTTNDTNDTPASSAPCQGDGGNLYTVQHHCTRTEVAELLHMSTRSVDRLLAQGRLTKVKFSEVKQGAVRIPYRSVLNYLKGMKQGAPRNYSGGTPN
mgnify:CR=1 FL=1